MSKKSGSFTVADVASFGDMPKSTEPKLRYATFKPEQESEGRVLRLAAIGGKGIGKTTMLLRIKEPDTFRSARIGTVGVDIFHQYIYLNEKSKEVVVKLTLNDFAGEDKFQTMLPAFARDLDGCFIMFDSTDKESFEHARHWQQELRKSNDYCICMLVATKIDLCSSEETKPWYSLDEMHKCSGDLDCAAGFAEISTLTKHNLDRAVLRLSQMAYDAKLLSEAQASGDSINIANGGGGGGANSANKKCAC
jgi:GTPase SAR1 family protein